MNANDIREHMTVTDSEGQHVGTVDKVENNQIKLTKKDSPDGQHHYISLDAVESVDGEEIRLSSTADEAMSAGG